MKGGFTRGEGGEAGNGVHGCRMPVDTRPREDRAPVLDSLHILDLFMGRHQTNPNRGTVYGHQPVLQKCPSHETRGPIKDNRLPSLVWELLLLKDILGTVSKIWVRAVELMVASHQRYRPDLDV